MRKFSLLLSCLAYTGHGRQIQPAAEQVHGQQVTRDHLDLTAQDNDLQNPLKTFALLLASKSGAGFNPPGTGAHPVFQQKVVNDPTISTSHRAALDRQRGDWHRSLAVRMAKEAEKFEPSKRVKVAVETRNWFLQSRIYFIQPVVIVACLLGSYLSVIRIFKQLDVTKDSTNLAINFSILVTAIYLEVKGFQKRNELLEDCAIELGEWERPVEEKPTPPPRPLTKKQARKAAKKEAKKLEKWGAPIKATKKPTDAKTTESVATATTAEDAKTTEPVATATTAEDGKKTD